MEFVELPEEATGSSGGDVCGPKLIDRSDNLIFGTEKVYIFMRLYCLLVQLLSDTKDLLKQISGDPHQLRKRLRGAVGPDYIDQEGKHEGWFACLVAALQRYGVSEIDYKVYETACRTLSQEKVDQLAALPRLVEKCADALVRMAKEDVILALFDLSQLKHRNPVLLRSQSINVCPDAVYRIQYHPVDMRCYMSYLPHELDLLTSPRSGGPGSILSGSMTDGDAAIATEEEDRGGGGLSIMADSDGGIRSNRGQLHQPQVKRIKLK